MVERIEPQGIAAERPMLEQWLDYHRATLASKCEGLTPIQLCERSVPPAILSLAGLVRHLADVERNWCRRVLAEEEAPAMFYSDAEPEGEFTAASPATAEADLATWRAECERARVAVAAVDSLDAVRHTRHGRPVSLRWIYVHLIEEYARHNGHADFLRERIDGVTGD